MSAQRETAGHKIVVGVDGSAPSKAALRWAIRQAALTGAAVEAVTAWHYPVIMDNAWAPVAAVADTDFQQIAARLLSQAVDEATGPTSKVPVSVTVRRGKPAKVLLDVAKDADLLVVGSHGQDGFAEAVLGPVSQRCAHHATCPVVLVRADDGS